jgi:phage protein D
VRANFFPNRTDNPLVSPNESNIDPARAQVMAEALLRRKAREFFTIEGTTIGLPRLRPGNQIQITGMRPPFDGYYYVTKTVHSYGADGLRVKFSARRPGMALPPYGNK